MAVKFNLGVRLKDKITGISGVAVGYYFHLNGCQYIEIEPDAKEGARVETVYLPEERFVLSAKLADDLNADIDNITDIKVPDITTCHVKLGDLCKDTLSGYTGHAILIQIPLYGVGRVAIEPKLDKEGKYTDATFFDEQRVEVIEVKAPPVAEAMPEERKKSGAAPSSALRYLRP